MITWEMQVLREHNFQKLMDRANELGAEGWEPFSFGVDDYQRTVHFVALRRSKFPIARVFGGEGNG